MAKSDLENFIEFCESDFGKKILKAEVEFIRKYLEGCEKILDVGCGIGAFEQLLPDLNITGLDSSEEFLAEAKRRNPNRRFVLGKAEDMGDFENGEFDGLFCVTTIEFIDDYKAVASEISRVLSPGARIVIMMLNPHSEYFKEHIKKRASYFHRIKHGSMSEIRGQFLHFFELDRRKYFLGIRGRRIFDTENIRYAALAVAVGRKLSEQN